MRQTPSLRYASFSYPVALCVTGCPSHRHVQRPLGYISVESEGGREKGRKNNEVKQQTSRKSLRSERAKNVTTVALYVTVFPVSTSLLVDNAKNINYKQTYRDSSELNI